MCNVYISCSEEVDGQGEGENVREADTRVRLQLLEMRVVEGSFMLIRTRFEIFNNSQVLLASRHPTTIPSILFSFFSWCPLQKSLRANLRIVRVFVAVRSTQAREFGQDSGRGGRLGYLR